MVAEPLVYGYPSPPFFCKQGQYVLGLSYCWFCFLIMQIVSCVHGLTCIALLQKMCAGIMLSFMQKSAAAPQCAACMIGNSVFAVLSFLPVMQHGAQQYRLQRSFTCCFCLLWECLLRVAEAFFCLLPICAVSCGWSVRCCYFILLNRLSPFFRPLNRLSLVGKSRAS